MALAKRKSSTAKSEAAANPLTQAAYAQSMATRWALADALMGGSDAMREMGNVLLPRHHNEEKDVYAARIARSFLLPVFSQSVEQLADIVFSDPMAWEAGLPPDLEALLANCGADGESIDGVGRKAMVAALSKGECYLICDEPPIEAADGKVVTLADRRAQGVRPYIGVIAADAMLAFETEVRDGLQYVTYARWSESERKSVAGGFVEQNIQRVIEWRPGVWVVHEKIDGGEWTRTEGILNCRREGKFVLPIVRFRLGKVDGYGRLNGPLQGLAEKNVEHWQSSSDQRAILTVSRFPMLGGAGVTGNDLQTDANGAVKVGPNITLFARDPQSKFYYVETNGAAIAAGEKDLERLEKDMSALAYQPLMRQQAGVTATKDALAESKANCSLAAWALELGRTLDRVVVFLSLWRGAVPPETNFVPATEFGIDVLDQVRVTALQAMRNSGDLGRKTFLDEMMRERVLSEEFDIEANEDQLDNEGPKLPDPLNQPPPPPEPDPDNPPEDE